jgi:hypothetical protein
MPNRNMRGPRNEGCRTGRQRGRLSENNAINNQPFNTRHTLRGDIDNLKARVERLEKQSQNAREEG